jgi:hypothetical protein
MYAQQMTKPARSVRCQPPQPQVPCHHFWYTKASSAYTALVQLYTRSGTTPTADGMFQKKATLSSVCRFGCPDTETPHHVFAVCDRFCELHHNELDSLVTSIKNRPDLATITPEEQLPFLGLAKSIFSDSQMLWPLHPTTFYLGHIPKIAPLLPLPSLTSSVTRSRLIHNIASDLHLSSVCLASRIFGNLQKEISKRHAAIFGNHP